MKHWKLIVGIIIVLIIIVIALVYLFTPKPTPTPAPSAGLPPNPFSDAVETGSANQETSPATFSVNFYKWYIGNVDSDSSFPTTQQLATVFTQWMTPSFILQYQSEGDDPNFDVDPILYTQDDPSLWGSGITATILSQTADSSTVQVVLGSGSTAHTFTLQLLKSNGQWLVNSVSGKP